MSEQVDGQIDGRADQTDLIEQRDFLLRSLDDLEREHDAHDIDDHDYENLRDDYIARAAAVMHALEQPSPPEPVAPVERSRRGRIAAWTAGVLAFAILAGLAVAWAAGRGGTGTNDATSGARENVALAEQLMGQGKFPQAIDAFSKAIDQQPSNARALTYRGWLYAQTGQRDKAWADLDSAVAVDPKLPDTHVFRAVLYAQDSKWDDADREYQAIDVANAPAEISQLLAEFRLHERIVAARVSAKVLPVQPSTTVASTGFSADDLRVAAEQLAEDGKVTDGLSVLQVVLQAKPDDAKALASEGWIVARSGQQLIDSGNSSDGQQLLTRGRSLLDKSVGIDGAYLPARVYRAFVSFAQGKANEADADLKIYESAKDQPADLQVLLAQNDLRAAIDKALQGK